MDVYNTLLQRDRDKEVYIKLPDNLKKKGLHKMCRLIKSPNGLKQASKQYNIKLTATLINVGFSESTYDYSLFTLQRKV